MQISICSRRGTIPLQSHINQCQPLKVKITNKIQNCALYDCAKG